MAQGKIAGSNMSGPIRTSSTNKNGGKQWGRQGTVTVTALASLAAATYTIADSNAMIGDVVVASPNATPEAGFAIDAVWVSAEGVISVKVRNASAVTLTGGAVLLNYFICK